MKCAPGLVLGWSLLLATGTDGAAFLSHTPTTRTELLVDARHRSSSPTAAPPAANSRSQRNESRLRLFPSSRLEEEAIIVARDRKSEGVPRPETSGPPLTNSRMGSTGSGIGSSRGRRRRSRSVRPSFYLIVMCTMDMPIEREKPPSATRSNKG